MESRPAWVRWFVAAQIGIPLALLALRWIEGTRVLYGWGWQMYSG